MYSLKNISTEAKKWLADLEAKERDEILRIIAEYLAPSQKAKAMVYIAFSYCVGQLANYIIAGVVLSVDGMART